MFSDARLGLGFSGTHLYLCIYNQPSWVTLKRYSRSG